MSIIFKNGSGAENINVITNKPLSIKVDTSAHVYIQSINISCLGGTLEKSVISLSGNFFNSKITVKTSAVIQAINDLKVK